MFRALIAAVLLCFSVTQAHAQDRFWVQIEAHPTLSEATERARVYARRFDDVQGYYLGRGFYGIVLGPYTETVARQELRELLRDRQIPSDSYLQNGRRFEQQFWPIGGGTATPRNAPEIDNTPVPELSALPQAPLTAPFETLREARASEAALLRTEREELQKALQWAGFYDAAIDGAFGRGTRRAMEAWQVAYAQDPTGVLTARQREQLLLQFNAVLIDLDMQMVRDADAGIQMQIPTAAVAFSGYQPPFAKFDGQGSVPDAQVLMMSQPGDAGRLTGLFEVLQVLDLMPPEGPRQLRGNSFFIEGADDERHSFATASLQDGEIKGFVLVWPAGDNRRRARILDVMQSSFERLDGTLDPNLIPPSDDQAIDMVAGLAVRQPKLSRSGFYVTGDGIVVTTPEAVDGCSRITFDRATNAEVIETNLDLGVAILRPISPLTPIDVATFQSDTPRLKDRVAVAGYPFNGVLTSPTLTFGTLEDIRDLQGDDRLKRLSLLAQASNAGGPVLDASGAVLGMLLPQQGASNQALPGDVQFSLDAAQIASLLQEQGIVAAQTSAGPAISQVALSRKAADVAVLVSCW
ncbi:serine protease [Roseobacter sp. CCS2]|uniref:serine protease n=1 Tax=Roseobacter sp. CCS2 TaxID=391593 RepID=UPI0000F3E3C3|nr:serine protease [Roseobacter sp. CCS2]EBA12836.1 peptidoglycan binding domain protein [Roseobacter sp. CCS2]